MLIISTCQVQSCIYKHTVNNTSNTNNDPTWPIMSLWLSIHSFMESLCSGGLSPSPSRDQLPGYDSQDTQTIVPLANYDTTFPWAPPTYSLRDVNSTAPRPSASRSHPAHRRSTLDDPLVAAARHNQSNPFYKLPDGIILGILKRLTNPDLECLRRVSRKFPPLVAQEAARSRRITQGFRLHPVSVHFLGPVWAKCPV